MNHAMLDLFAFPRYAEGDGEGSSTYGLSKRELFAALALQGMLASEAETYNYGGGGDRHHRMALSAVAHADALLQVLSNPEVTA